MIHRLPTWVWLGALLLSGVAGYVNAVAVLGFGHQAVSHITGALTRAALAAGDAAWPLLGHLAAMVAAFFAGAALCGVVVRDGSLQLGRRYGVALLLESALLALAVPLLGRAHLGGELLAAAACGLQNGMATTYTGAIVRTTHMTGVLTDLGLFVGRRLRGIAASGRHARLHATLLAGFVLGGLAGGWGFARFSHAALLLPAAATGAAALGYLMLRMRVNAPA